MLDYLEKETELIKKAQSGDEAGFKRLLNAYKGRIFSYSYRIVQNYQDAEEITFDTFIKCYKSLPGFDLSKPLAPYLFTIAHNTIMDFLRKNRQHYDHLEELHGVVNGLDKKMDQKRRLERVEVAMADLAPVDREIVILFHKEELSYQEISETLNLPVTTIKTRLHRAREKLRKLASGAENE